ncbi:uncharacterized protein LOC142235723 [Haematobia irritans]|uniref:uncharacterized protein LOC142235723 n=1 Tax=Haematobia irritans TaxID=7368 RepID=UPI003F4F6BB0
MDVAYKSLNALKHNLKEVKIERNEIIISLDVISLFTNIPVHTAVQIIMKQWEKIKLKTKISRSTFLRILNFCLLENNYFMYDNKIYNQIFGMPMGNPLSPIIADIVLDNLLDNALADLQIKDINIKYITKYVDDILAIIDKDDAETILNTFNQYHPKIQFTIEKEKDNKIAYLDTKLHNIDGNIKFDWYAKEISTGRIMNYNATQPRSQILNTAKNLIYRILTLSDENYHNKNIGEIHKILTNNSFPRSIIEHLIKETKRKISKDTYDFTIKNNNDQNDNNERIFHGVKYIPGLIDNANLRETISTKNICFAFKPHNTLSAVFTKVKTPIQKEQQHDVVYEISCKGSDKENVKCDRIYIGTTKRALETRIGEHKADIEKRKERTALSQHIKNTGHTADFENYRILDKEKREKKRMTIESLRIQQNIRRTMNLKEDTDNISAAYSVAILKPRL